MLLLFSTLLAPAILGFYLPFKHLSGLPDEFPLHRIPPPGSANQSERSYVLRINLGADLARTQNRVAQYPIVVDSTEGFAFLLAHRQSGELGLRLMNPSGVNVPLTGRAHHSEFPFSDDSALSVPMDVYIFARRLNDTIEAGTWQLEVSDPSGRIAAARRDALPDARIMVSNDSPYQVDAFISETEIQVNKPIDVRARIVGEDGSAVLVSDAHVNLVLVGPDGRADTIPMNPTAVAAGEAPLYGAQFTVPSSGVYFAKVDVDASAGGVAFKRSTFQPISVSADLVSFTGRTAISHPSTGVVEYSPVPAARRAAHLHWGSEVGGRDVPASTIEVFIGLADVALWAERYVIYAEVHGDGGAEGLCWVGGISLISNVPDFGRAVSVFVDGECLARGRGPYVFKHVSLYSEVNLANVGEIPLPPQFTTAAVAAARVARLAGARVRATPAQVLDSVAFRFGPVPEMLRARIGAKLVNGSLVTGTALSHGYCTEVNPWSKAPQVWTHNPKFFKDYMQSRSTDHFANLVAQFMANEGVDAYSWVGHSQGGPVGTHLHNYYWSGLDVLAYPAVFGGEGVGAERRVHVSVGLGIRPVQSVGSPYGGSAIAGSLADLGKIFGIGCGGNYDMTHDGSNVWMRGISAAIRPNVYYFTTTYKLGTFFGDSCSTAVNMILAWPNDGVTELKYAKSLTGANYVGNTEQQCHTLNMNYIAQYDDLTRNADMNQYTAMRPAESSSADDDSSSWKAWKKEKGKWKGKKGRKSRHHHDHDEDED